MYPCYIQRFIPCRARTWQIAESLNLTSDPNLNEYLWDPTESWAQALLYRALLHKKPSLYSQVRPPTWIKMDDALLLSCTTMACMAVSLLLLHMETSAVTWVTSGPWVELSHQSIEICYLQTDDTFLHVNVLKWQVLWIICLPPEGDT